MKSIAIAAATVAIGGFVFDGTSWGQKSSTPAAGESSKVTTRASSIRTDGDVDEVTIVKRKEPKSLTAARRLERLMHELSEADSDAKKAEIKKKLESVVTESFEEDMKVREHELKHLEDRVSKFRARLDRRQKAKSEIIELEVKVLVNEASGLGFDDILSKSPKRVVIRRQARGRGMGLGNMMEPIQDSSGPFLWGRNALESGTRPFDDLLHELSEADSDAKKSEITKKLEAAVAKAFEEDMKVREEELKHLDARLAKLRTQLDRRRKAQSEIVQLEVKVLVNEADDLGFGDRPSKFSKKLLERRKWEDELREGVRARIHREIEKRGRIHVAPDNEDE